MQHVVATLRARLDVVVSAPAKVAGLSDDEQASNQLASAVSSALQSTEAPQAVHASVAEGLQEAATTLQESGASASDLDAALGDLSDKLNDLFAAFSPAASAPGTSEVATVGAHIVTKEKGVLEIRTQEGDIVKVKFATRNDVRAGFAQATSDGVELTSANLSITTDQRTQLSVKGDLNADELKAIADVVQKVDALANDFFAGNVDEALSQATHLDIDTEQLANVALRLSVKQRIETTAVSVKASLPAAAPVPAPEESVPVETPAETPSVPVAETAPVPTAEVAPATEVEQLAPEIVSAAPAAGAETAESSSPQNVIAKFVARVLATFQSSEAETRVSLSFKLKLQLLTSAIEAKQPGDTTQGQTCVKKLCDVAETAAAK